MVFKWSTTLPWMGVDSTSWQDWRWQMRNSWKKYEDFACHWTLSSPEVRGLKEGLSHFKVRVTPYYARLVDSLDQNDPIRKIIVPTSSEWESSLQQELDPLGEQRHRPTSRIVHRYSDRALFLVTDQCSVYCRYCTRKHFTASGESTVRGQDYEQALQYLKAHKGLREVILSGGDPLTLGDSSLTRICADLREIDHIEIIRVGTRMAVVCPMRVTSTLIEQLKPYGPIFFMHHFNHPRELTAEAVQALRLMVDGGFPSMNQMVLLNGVNNHPAIVQALSRRLLYLRVYPYYMFQCDPSLGTDHLRTSVEQSLQIQRELWGHLSGLALPQLSLDIPSGGGKAYYVPNFEVRREVIEQSGVETRFFQGWDGVQAEYLSPPSDSLKVPSDVHKYSEEWDELRSAKKSNS
jgi:lysine 2,3-aminomutase